MIVLTFDSTHQALTAEKNLLEHMVNIEIMPTPRSVSANCGISIKVSEQSLDLVQAILTKLNINPKFYRAPDQKGGAYVQLQRE